MTDRISSLPNNVREHILMFLPLRDAAKSSILSTVWRNMWMDLPTLVFDENFCSQEEHLLDKLMLDLCIVLLLHRGPLKEFSLSFPVLLDFPDQPDQILMFLQNNKRIDSLTIKAEEYCPTEKYKLSRRLFQFSHLKTLHLSECEVKYSPNEFRGFVNLTVLRLKSVEFFHSDGEDDDTSVTWSFTFPLLSSFSLVNCACGRGLSWRLTPYIEIDAPKLSCFHFVGDFVRIKFKCTPVLQTATLGLKDFCSVLSKSAMIDLRGGLAAVESLSVSGDFCRYLKKGIEESNDLRPFEMLRNMTFWDQSLSSQNLVDTVLVMITSSPNLQRLEIMMKDTYEASGSNISFDERVPVCDLGRLERVEVKNLRGTEYELAVVKWLLSSSPALDIMNIKLSAKLSDAEKIRFLTALNGFARASSRAVVKIESFDQNLYVA
ncbi:F-box/FBD/LRR-repeat protein At1g13570 [Linum grandiflorum]